MGSQGQEQYVTVCVCWAVRKSMRHTAGRSYSSNNEQANNDMLPPPHISDGVRGRKVLPVGVSHSLSPLTHASQSQKFAGTLNFEVSALLRRHWESENVSFQWESGGRESEQIDFFFAFALVLALSVSLPLTTCGVWRWTRFVVFAFLCFSSTLAHTKAQTTRTHTYTHLWLYVYWRIYTRCI